MRHLNPAGPNLETNLETSIETSIELSRHAARRAQQRAIRPVDIEIALLYGERQWSRGDHSFVLTDRALQDTPFQQQCDRLRGLCVVLARDNVVRTVKWDFRRAGRPGVLRRAYLNQYPSRPRACGHRRHGAPHRGLLLASAA